MRMMSENQGPKGAVPRAPRFPVHVRMKYRREGERSWCEGWTENISRSGVLFRADRLLTPETTVEMSLALPPAMSGESPANVLCRGQIVRIRESSVGGDYLALAATIREFEFLRGAEDA